jgi:dienelactone hydrolase
LASCDATPRERDPLAFFNKSSTHVVLKEEALRAVRPPPSWSSAADLRSWQTALRARLLDGVLVRRSAWEHEAPAAETVRDGDRVVPRAAFTVERLRYQPVPGMWQPALHYRPKLRAGERAPAVVVYEGHYVPPSSAGLASPDSRRLCAHLALHGVHAFHIELLASSSTALGDNHQAALGLALVGIPSSEPFIINARRGLEMALSSSEVDSAQVGVAGLSGGGWQAMMMAALDERVAFGMSVAGFAALEARLLRSTNSGDTEQWPPGLFNITDYDEIAALIAPRPFVFAYHQHDSCCFDAASVVPGLRQTFHAAWGVGGALPRIIVDPLPEHVFNGELRATLYALVNEVNPRASTNEPEQSQTLGAPFVVPLPPERLTLRQYVLAEVDRAKHGPLPASRALLAARLGFERWDVHAGTSTDLSGAARAIAVTFTGSAHAATLVVLDPTTAQVSGTSIVVSDVGRARLAPQVAELRAHGRRVIAVDLRWMGSASARAMPHDVLQAIGTGRTLLGQQTNELSAIARLVAALHPGHVEVVAIGPRASMVALSTAALETAVDEAKLTDVIGSLRDAVAASWWPPSAPEVFTPGLLPQLDLVDIAELVAPRPVTVSGFVLGGPTDRWRRASDIVEP